MKRETTIKKTKMRMGLMKIRSWLSPASALEKFLKSKLVTESMMKKENNLKKMKKIIKVGVNDLTSGFQSTHQESRNSEAWLSDNRVIPVVTPVKIPYLMISKTPSM
jgi:4-diphosphocytidyl-2C-methyl-D-erythritol kinase